MSDYLTDEEQVDRLKKLWKDYGITVVVALAVGIGGTVAWDYFKAYQSDKAQDASNLYTSYLEASGLGEPTSSFVEELESNYGQSAYFAFTLLRQAKGEVDEANFEAAHESLTRAFEVARGSPIGDLVALRKAKVEFELGDYESVLLTLQEVQTAGYRWQALMLKGDVHFQNNELDAARDAYQSAKDQLPVGFESGVVEMRLASVPPAP
ncbi:MAG: tetratricopeptide repeat protein [Gammaproteobacteria bacterium]|nr:tetratricopeptide repeat protein [Gammaproteobacteria bacterium]